MIPRGRCRTATWNATSTTTEACGRRVFGVATGAREGVSEPAEDWIAVNPEPDPGGTLVILPDGMTLCVNVSACELPMEQ